MNNKLPIIALSSVVAALSLTHCSDVLDLDPPMTRVTDNFYLTEEDALQALTAAYNVLTWSAPSTSGGSPQNCAFELISEVLGDHCYGGGANANDIPTTVRLSNFTTYATDPAPEALWSKYYTGIYRCNQFLEKIEGIPFEDITLRQQYIAEVHFLRAYYYFDLVRLFGNVPLILKPLTSADYAQVQATPQVIYEQIAKDLLWSIDSTNADGTSLLPETAMDLSPENKGRATLAASESLLARVWLYYTGYYNQPELPLVSPRRILDIIDAVVLSAHSLVADGYAAASRITGSSKLFDVTNKGSAEGVFEIQYSALSKWGDWGSRQGCMGNQAVILWGMRDVGSPYAAGWSFAPVNAKLFDQFDAADPRRWATLINANAASGNNDGEGLTYTKGYQNTGYFNRKYTPFVRNNAGAGSRELNYPNNYQSIRYADVLLMSAELEFKYGNKNFAYERYREVRERAMGAGSAGTVGDLSLQKIYDERIYELSLEGHRYWDILRQGQDYAAQTLTNGELNEYQVVYNTARAGLLPIPQYEITQSKNSLKQNPGY